MNGKIVGDKIFGIYKGTGSQPWYGGELQQSGDPASDGPGSWAGNWFKTRKEAEAYTLLKVEEERDFIKSFEGFA